MDETTTRNYSIQAWRDGGPSCDYASSLIEPEGVSKKCKSGPTQ
jgi:hypothetical protein